MKINEYFVNYNFYEPSIILFAKTNIKMFVVNLQFNTTWRYILSVID